MCTYWLFIYVDIHSPQRLRDVRVVFVFNASESDWAPSEFILFPVACVRMNKWVSRCVCLEREMCVCLCVLIIHIYILFTRLQDWEMWELCSFSMLLKVIELLLNLFYSLLCVWEWWMGRCVCLGEEREKEKGEEKEKEKCVLIIHICIYSLTCKIERCESCVCFQYFWKWFSSFWIYRIHCCVCERMNEWMNEWMNE
jgi:hypothetical protein